MPIIQRYTNSYNTISNMISDGTAFVWIAYSKNSSGVCHLQKVYANALDQVIYDISITANQIVDMTIGDNYLHLLFDNATTTYIGKSLSLTSPNLTQVNYTRPASIVEEPVSISYSESDSHINFLTPGDSSATNSQVYRYELSTGDLSETIAIRIDDIRIVEARSMSVDSNGDIWIATYTDPVKLIRMYFASGGWHFAFTNIV